MGLTWDKYNNYVKKICKNLKNYIIDKNYLFINF